MLWFFTCLQFLASRQRQNHSFSLHCVAVFSRPTWDPPRTTIFFPQAIELFARSLPRFPVIKPCAILDFLCLRLVSMLLPFFILPSGPFEVTVLGRPLSYAWIVLEKPEGTWTILPFHVILQMSLTASSSLASIFQKMVPPDRRSCLFQIRPSL